MAKSVPTCIYGTLECVSVLVVDSPDAYTPKTLFYAELAVYVAFEQRKTGEQALLMLFGTKIAKFVSMCHEFGTCVRVLDFFASFMGSRETKNSISDFEKSYAHRNILV